jgi:hypothetical protein
MHLTDRIDPCRVGRWCELDLEQVDARAAMRAAILTVDPKISSFLRITGPQFTPARVSGNRESLRHACNKVPNA